MLTSKSDQVSPARAQLYGLPSQTAWAQLDLPPERSGLLTQASVLTLTSRPTRTSPTLRGRYVREVVLCQKLPDPPANVNTTLPPDPTLTQRQQLEQHINNPSCSGCHQKMDPVGFGLEQFDPMGRYRATDASAAPISAAGKLIDFTPQDFNGPLELSSRLAQSKLFEACVPLQLFRYGMGRRETTADTCSIAQLTHDFSGGQHRFRQAMLDLVRSDTFRYRLPNGGP
jgi:hypothetical protein